MGSSRIIHTDSKGLVTAPGLLTRAESSCIQADNVTFDAPGVIRKRRGFESLAGNVGGPAWKIFTSRALADDVMIHRGTGGGTALVYGDGSSFSAIPVVPNAVTRSTTNRAAMAVANRNHYVTADEGVIRVESSFTSDTQRAAGMPRGMPPEQYIGWALGRTTIVAGTNFGDGYARAYRVTWHRTDNDGIELGGAPTGRQVFYNMNGYPGWVVATTCAFSLLIRLPQELSDLGTDIESTWFFRLWGTRSFNAAGGEQGDDECYLITEQYVTSTDITNGRASYTDSTPDSFLVRQPRLHTNITNFPQSELGVAQGTLNEDAPPPSSNDVAFWQDCMWYADCRFRPRTQVRLLAVGGSGLVAADTVTITGPSGATLTVTAAAPSTLTTEFTVFTGFATTQQNVEATAVNLVEAINLNAIDTLGVRAYYVSVGNQTPGYIYLESLLTDEDATATTAVKFNCSRAAAFSLLDASGDSVATTDERANALYFSKPGRADAVPPVNNLSVGPADSRILRIHPYRGRLLVFTDYGIYQVTGSSFVDFSVSAFDLGYRLLARETVVTCDEKVYAWCYEGIVEIDDSGVSVVSLPIEPSIQQAVFSCGTASSGDFDTGQASFAELCFAVAYRNQHRVLFFYPEAQVTNTVQGCGYWWSWDTRTRAWSRGLFSGKVDGYNDNRTCGVVRLEDDLLVCGNWSAGSDTYVFQEKRTLTSADYVDEVRDGTTTNVTAEVAYQFQIPEPDGAVHWQQVTVHLEGGEQGIYPAATAITAAWTMQAGGTTASYAMTGNTNTFVRFETPQEVRRGNRIRLRLSNSAQEFFGIWGVTMGVRSGARFALRSQS